MRPPTWKMPSCSNPVIYRVDQKKSVLSKTTSLKSLRLRKLLDLFALAYWALLGPSWPYWALLGHPPTSSRDHSPAAAATTIPWLSFGFQRPHRPDFKLFWSAAAAAAGMGCLSHRVCAVNPKNKVLGRCRPTKPCPCGWVAPFISPSKWHVTWVREGSGGDIFHVVSAIPNYFTSMTGTICIYPLRLIIV